MVHNAAGVFLIALPAFLFMGNNDRNHQRKKKDHNNPHRHQLLFPLSYHKAAKLAIKSGGVQAPAFDYAANMPSIIIPYPWAVSFAKTRVTAPTGLMLCITGEPFTSASGKEQTNYVCFAYPILNDTDPSVFLGGFLFLAISITFSVAPAIAGGCLLTMLRGRNHGWSVISAAAFYSVQFAGTAVKALLRPFRYSSGGNEGWVPLKICPVISWV